MSADTPEPPVVHVFFDYICPYAYVGKLRADKLAKEVPVRFAWLPWEIGPTRAPLGEPRGEPTREFYKISNAYVQRLAQEVGGSLKHPSLYMNSNLALRGAEYAKDQGEEVFARYHTLAFDAVWQRNLNIGDPKVLASIAREAGMDPEAFLEGIRHQAYQNRLLEVDAAAERVGVKRVPTFVFGDQRIVGNDAFEPSLKTPLLAYLERRRVFGEHGSSIEDDTGLADL